MPRSLSSFFCVVVVALSAAGARAQDRAEPPQDYLDPVVVTPTGQPSRVSESPSTTFVITGDEVRRSGATSLPEILRRVPGLDVRAISATDGQLGLRGFAYEITDRILVMVDGRTVYIDFFGGTAYEMLPVSLVDVERIEVVLGPGASVYGNKAMLGTINVITRSALDYPFAEARVDAGPPGDGRVGARWGAIRGPWRLRATGLARRLTLFEPQGREPSIAGGGTLSASYSPSTNAEASLEIGGMDGDTYMIPTQDRLERFEGVVLYARGQGRLGLGGPGAPHGYLNLDAVWNTGRIRSSKFPSDTNPLRATYHTPYARLHHDFRGQLWDVPMRLRWGGEVRLNTLDSTVTTGERDLWNLAAFASDEVELGRWRLTAGLRVDRSTLTRFHASPRVSAVWSPVDGHQLRASFNTGYNDAHLLHYFTDLKLPSSDGSTLYLRGNRELDAEGVRYGEVGWAGELTSYLRAFATAFAYRLTHWISLNPRSLTPTGEAQYGNNDALDVYGGEVGVEVAVRRWLRAYASDALVGPRGRRVYPYQTDAHGSPKHKVSAGARIEAPWGLYATIDGQYFGRSEVARLRSDWAPPFDPSTGDWYERSELGDYVMLHARVGYAFASGLDLSAAVTNALDAHTPQFPGAERPERRFAATVAYHP